MPQTLNEWLLRLEKSHSQEIDLGLERVAKVARSLSLITDYSKGDSEPYSGDYLGCAKVVTIAGTNGKGSCVKALSDILMSNNQSVGCYTSPHLLKFNERVVVNGRPVADDELCHAFTAIDCAREETSLTYFEFATLAALWIFKQKNVAYCLLEVGLGGRLDATNIVNADVAVITSVDLDHQDWLGDTRELIALEKAGISRAGRPLVSSVVDVPSTLQVFCEQRSPNYLLGRDFCLEKRSSAYVFTAKYAAPASHGGDSGGALEEPATAALKDDETISFHFEALHLPLTSVACALMAAVILGQLPDKARLRTTLANSRLPGRMEHHCIASKTVILDVAHNPAAAVHLVKQLMPQTFAIVFAIMADKEVSATLEPLMSISDHWYLGNLDIDRAMAAKDLSSLLKSKQQSVSTYSTVARAFEAALDSQYSHIIVAGSFYTVAAVGRTVETLQGKAYG